MSKSLLISLRIIPSFITYKVTQKYVGKTNYSSPKPQMRFFLVFIEHKIYIIGTFCVEREEAFFYCRVMAMMPMTTSLESVRRVMERNDLRGFRGMLNN